MPLLYRPMIADNDAKPLVVPTARGLGVRRDVDTFLDEFDYAHPGEGMSVSPDSIENLPEHRRPPAAGGTGKDPVWEINSDDLPEELKYQPDEEDPTHGWLEPAWPMHVEDYENALAETRDFWRQCT